MSVHDLRYAWRVIAGNRKSTIVMTLTLAIGIGATTTVFTLLNAVLLRPLPVEDPAGLVGVYTTDTTNATANFTRFPISYLNYQDLRSHNDVFSGVAAFIQRPMTLTEVGAPRPVAVELVTVDYFKMLGVEPAVGRTFSHEEADESAAGRPVAVISHQMWVNVFGADRQLAGRTIRLNAQRYTVVGIMPPRFKGLVSLASPEQIWLPLALSDQILPSPFREFLKTRRGIFMSAFGRLKPGVTLTAADAAVKTLGLQLERDYPDANRGRGLTVFPIADAAVGVNDRSQFARAGWVLITVVGLLLVIVCINVAHLLLGRAVEREGEIAVRVALGASRWQIMRQLLAECLVLSALGGIAGVVLAWWLLSLFWSLRPQVVPVDALELTLDLRILAFTAVVSLVTAVVAGLVPAIRATSPHLADVLKSSGRPTTVHRRALTMYDLLVAAQIAFALFVVIAAGLFVRGARHAQQLDPGFESKKLFVFGFDLSSEGYQAERGQQYFERAIEEARATPGVERATVASNVPFAVGAVARTVFPDGRQSASAPGVLSNINVVSADFFQTLRIPLRDGRFLNEFDREGTRPVAVMNEAAAQRFWPGTSALAKQFNLRGDATLREVVGIVGNTVQFRTGEAAQPVIYLPMRQSYTPAAFLYVRTAGDAEATLPTVQRKVEALDRNLAITNPATIEELISRDLWAPRAGAALLSAFGVVALVLAAVGIYGVMSHAVVRRTQEVGIRMAMGARGADIIRLLLGRGVGVTAVGLGLGLVAALVVSRSARSLLYGLSPVDPIAFAGALVVLGLIALLSCYLPARRATRVDPIRSLRLT